jgi:RimJ/RimL family protein N-acetyltransferase
METTIPLMLKNGAEIELRAMRSSDVPEISAFLRAMPDRDLLFFRNDPNDEAVREWTTDAVLGDGKSIVAVDKSKIIGFAYVQRRRAAWLRHVGDVAGIVARPMRNGGLGSILLREILLQAGDLGLSKVMAHVLIEDREIIHVFERLGFRHEGTLLNHARDGNGQLYDLALLGIDLRDKRSRLAGDLTDRLDLTRR